MANEIFSQTDIDALLGGVQAKVEAAPAPVILEKKTGLVGGDVSSSASLYDFRRPHRVSQDKLRALEAMYERMAKTLESWLIGRLRGQVQVNVQSVEQLTFGEFVLSLDSPCAAYLFDVVGAGGLQGVVSVGPEISFYVVDRLFGGRGEPLVLNRSLTKIEVRSVRVLVEKLIALVGETWRDHVRLNGSVVGFESVPEILQAASREDAVLVTHFEVSTGWSKGLIGICLPIVALEKFFSGQGNLRVKHPPLFADARERIEQANAVFLREVEIYVAVRLPEFFLPMREIGSLEEGSVIATGLKDTVEAEGWIGEDLRLKGLPKSSGSTLSLQVTKVFLASEGEGTFPDGDSNEVE